MTTAVFLNALGITNPLGVGKAQVAEALFAGSQAGLVRRDDLIPDRSITVGAVVGELPDMPESLAKHDCRNNRLMLLALAEIDSDIRAIIDRYGANRVAVVMGTSTSGVSDAEPAISQKMETGEFPAGYSYARQEMGELASFVAARFGVTGPALTISTACTSSAKTLGTARRYIRAGICDAAIVGGADTLCKLTLNGFHALDSLSDGICNPFSVNRDGITVGEGAAVFVLSRDEAMIRLAGVGESSDAHHLSAPDPAGRGAETAMRAAVEDAGIASTSVGYINLHGTATRLNDAMESGAVSRVFGREVSVSSTKPMTGHMLGAAGANEIAFLWLAMHKDGKLPPHLWDGMVDPDLEPINLGGQGAAKAMLSNSFAFGGNNISVLLQAA